MEAFDSGSCARGSALARHSYKSRINHGKDGLVAGAVGKTKTVVGSRAEDRRDTASASSQPDA